MARDRREDPERVKLPPDELMAWLELTAAKTSAPERIASATVFPKILFWAAGGRSSNTAWGSNSGPVN